MFEKIAYKKDKSFSPQYNRTALARTEGRKIEY